MHFEDVNGPTPNLDEVKAIYDEVEQTINSSNDIDEMIESLTLQAQEESLSKLK